MAVSVPPRAGASLRRGRARGQIRRRRLGARLLEALDDDRVQLRVHALDARDGRVDQLARARLALADQLGLRGRIEKGQFVAHQATLRQPPAGSLVSRTRSPLPKSGGDRRPWEAATTGNSWGVSGGGGR